MSISQVSRTPTDNELDRLAFDLAMAEMARREKIRAALRGRVRTPEARARISEGLRFSWARRKAAAGQDGPSASAVATRETELTEMPNRPSEAASRT